MVGSQEVPLDREAIKLLASDTRLDILKALKKRRMTVSELATVLNLGKSTVFEHVSKLVEGGLVVRKDDPEREWVYYELSHRAQRLLSPDTAKIILLFSALAAALLLGGAGYVLYSATTEAPADGGEAALAAASASFAPGSDPRILAGEETSSLVQFNGPGPAAFYLLTEDQKAQALELEMLPPGARPLSST
ncbi:MAG TPA: winged helix-turn-helix domain-containing protein, partial [Candidatus Thermoplasmatota archaeon]|nr:winged helix-turn-helix domain-containing protein [Candidatus Thermoplasmatota archaeon]